MKFALEFKDIFDKEQELLKYFQNLESLERRNTGEMEIFSLFFHPEITPISRLKNFLSINIFNYTYCTPNIYESKE